jgi:hypothetical protein
MELYKIPAGSKFKISPNEKVQIPPDSPAPDYRDVYKLHNIDGMYSYCTDVNGRVVHLAAWTDVEVVSG